MDYASELQRIEEQEQTLQFSEFTNETALTIGLLLIEAAKSKNKAIAIDITRSGQILFHYSFAGTSPDNDFWILRKNKVVNRFQRSSYFFEMLLKRDGKTLEEESEISHFEFAAHGGAFPIFIRNVGAVGTITVSGLTSKEDHEMVISAVTAYLNN